MISWRNIAAYAPLITTLLVNRFQTCRTLIRNLHKVVVAVGGDESVTSLLAYFRCALPLPSDSAGTMTRRILMPDSMEPISLTGCLNSA